MDSAPTQPRTATQGAFLPRPEMSLTSRVPRVWSMAPTIMNRAALNSEWLKVSARPAINASREPMEITDMMKPSCDTVP